MFIKKNSGQKFVKSVITLLNVIKFDDKRSLLFILFLITNVCTATCITFKYFQGFDTLKCHKFDQIHITNWLHVKVYVLQF